jgi:hypothetical protein
MRFSFLANANPYRRLRPKATGIAGRGHIFKADEHFSFSYTSNDFVHYARAESRVVPKRQLSYFE